jgi:thiosulfate/3-mercaptopyruvate sulfurtransferase
MVRRIFTKMFPALALITVLASAVWAQQPQGYKGYARGAALITAKELKQLIDAKDPKLVILAAENDVEYRLGHIPGSHQVDRPAYEAPPETQGGITGNLIDAAGFTKLAQHLGVDKDSKVIVYDTKYDATRLWWAFFYYGKTDVRVLDGGIKAWKESGYETALLAPDAAKQGTFVAGIFAPRFRVDTPEILALQGSGVGQLWDNRDGKEYCGEELKKGAYRKGRIPWGKHSDWAIFKKKENAAEWISATEAQGVLKKLGADPKKDQYFFCQSGVRSTQALFTFYLLGWPQEKLHNHDSSWIGWSKDPSLPIETGCSVNTPLALAR